MQGFLTVCFCDWTKDSFSPGVMRIVKGKRTDQPLRQTLANKKEGVDYYIKPDPNFSNFTYSHCHKQLRQQLKPGDILFFRTLWRKKPYFIGYFLIKKKIGDPNNPICLADRNGSFLTDGFNIEITPEIVKKLNPRAIFTNSQHLNSQINQWLGRNYLRLDTQKTFYLIKLIQQKIKKNKRLYFKVVTEDLKSVGLLRANIVQYKLKKWVFPKEPLSCHPYRGGGLWALKRKSDAFQVKKYLAKQHNKNARIFLCQIDCILYETSYRIKTNRIKLVQEIK